MDPAANIALIGPMGSGKTEVGRLLAQRLGREFLDTDDMVTKKDGRAIGQIFAEDGEAGFRKLEAEAVAEVASKTGVVVALGGGAVMDPANASAVKSAGPVVYLKAGADLSAARVGLGEGRPLLAGTDTLKALTDLLVQREPAYEQVADHVILADGTPEEVVERILAGIGESP